MVTKAREKSDPELPMRLQRRAAIACCALRRAPQAPSPAATAPAALLTIADAVISRYQAEKDRRGLLDYDDLIDKTLAPARARSAPPGCTTSSTAASTTC